VIGHLYLSNVIYISGSTCLELHLLCRNFIISSKLIGSKCKCYLRVLTCWWSLKYRYSFCHLFQISKLSLKLKFLKWRNIKYRYPLVVAGGRENVYLLLHQIFKFHVSVILGCWPVDEVLNIDTPSATSGVPYFTTPQILASARDLKIYEVINIHNFSNFKALAKAQVSQVEKYQISLSTGSSRRGGECIFITS
jgi:hypothetical protein